MEIFAREEFHHFVDYAFQEFKYFFLGGTHHNVFHAPNDARTFLNTLARKFGIGCDGCHFVTRKFQFGHEGDEAVGCILHDVLNFFLSVVAGVLSAFAFGALGCYLHKFWILLDFDAPALVVGEVPVHAVHLEECDNVDILLNVFGRHKVTTRVEHDAAIAKAWLILNAHGRCHPCYASCLFGILDFGRKQLHKGLHGVEQALRSLSHCLYAFGGNFEGVTFVVGVEGFIDAERNVAFLGYFDVVAGRRTDFCCEKFGYGLCLVGGCPHRGAAVNNELAFHQFLWLWNDVDTFVVRLYFGFTACAQ